MIPNSPLLSLSLADRRALRQWAVLGEPLPLCDERGLFGPPVLPLTPHHHRLLLCLQNPIFCGGAITLRAVLQYLWIVSPCHRLRAPLREHFFRRRWRAAVSIKGQPSARAVRACVAHSHQALFDRPQTARTKEEIAREQQRPFAPIPDGPHELLVFEMLCRTALGYTPEEYWRTPYVSTNGKLAAMQVGRRPDAPKFDAARDRQAKEFLRRRRQAAPPARDRN